MDQMNNKLPEKNLEEFFKLISDKIFQQVIERMSTQTPDLLINFQSLHDEILLNTKQLINSFKDIDKKLKKIVSSPCLYEDVYKMRDELNEIKKTIKQLYHQPDNH